jgi:cytochrome b6-f complex iron-sulfur subunit
VSDDKTTAGAAPAAQPTRRAKPERKPIDRRAFLRASLIGSVSAGLGGFALGALGFLWPRLGDGLFGEIALGDARELAQRITSERRPILVPEAALSIIAWDPSDDQAAGAYGAKHAIVTDTVGLMCIDTGACPHLGCAVPWCQTSQWFECPCHGSRYNKYGEWTGGPAPRGLDRYVSFVDAEGQLVVDFSSPITGPARTANALEQAREGPSCIDA